VGKERDQPIPHCAMRGTTVLISVNTTIEEELLIRFLLVLWHDI
jgi:hypothetical protein